MPVGLGVDGSASNESGAMIDEPHQALLAARLRNGPLSLTVRQALELATMGGARCLGRAGEIGSLEPGKLADFVVLAGNPLRTVPERIADIPVLATVVDGTPTYQPGDVLVPGR